MIINEPIYREKNFKYILDKYCRNLRKKEKDKKNIMYCLLMKLQYK